MSRFHGFSCGACGSMCGFNARKCKSCKGAVSYKPGSGATPQKSPSSAADSDLNTPNLQ